MGKVRPYDYLFLSTRVKSLERNLLNRERMDRMLEARSNEDALEVLLECNYGEVPAANVQAIDKAIDVQRTKMMEDLAAFADRLEKATVQTIEEGVMTGDLMNLSTLPEKHKVGTMEFLDEVAKRLS